MDPLISSDDTVDEASNDGEDAAPAPVSSSSNARFIPPVGEDVQVFTGEWDDEGVWVYQAYNDKIADFAVQNQTFLDCPGFCPLRMTWIKPSFGWILYRSGYGSKHSQNRVLKLKLSHSSLAALLEHCKCIDTNKATKNGGQKKSADLSNGVIQWDPERDMMSADAREPRKLLRRRAIQIGLKGKLSEQYVRSILSVADVTPLAQKVGAAHALKNQDMSEVKPLLPCERPYLPQCSQRQLTELGMLPGNAAKNLGQLGRGKAC